MRELLSWQLCPRYATPRWAGQVQSWVLFTCTARCQDKVSTHSCCGQQCGDSTLRCGGIVLVVTSMLLLGAARFLRACEAGRCQQLSVVREKRQYFGLLECKHG